MGSKRIKKKAVVSDGKKTHQGSRKPLPRKAKQKQAITAITKKVQNCSKKQIPRTVKPGNEKSRFCNACHAIFDRSEVELNDDYSISNRCHHLTRDSMQAAVEAGCELCGILWDLWQKGFGVLRTRLRDSNLDRPFLSYQFCMTRDKDSLGSYLFFKISNVDDGSDWQAVCSKYGVQPQSIRSASVFFELHPTTDREHTQNYGCRNYDRQTSLGEPSTSVEGSSFQIARWLRRCDKTHSCTSNPARAAALFSMPSRVLDINHPDGTDYLRVDSSPPIAPYATLSHCWGPVEERKPPQLTLANWGILTERISITALPRTFQDAVLVVKDIGVRYLWIDSLCIIQDSISDWQKESGRMTEIYRNAVVNIAAEAATDCHAGLFVRRDNERARAHALTKVNIASSPSQDYLICPLDYRERNEDNPLRKRAWTFQERLLAPRQISFGEHQVMWKCSRLAACEVFPSGYPHSSTREHLDSEFLLSLKSDHSMEDAPGRLWYRLVEAYAKGALTREEDKLVAIQGVVKLLKPMLKDDYLAGLWRKSLISDLLWYVEGSASRPRKYRAPTWSWASVEGQIKWYADLSGTTVPSDSTIKILDVRIIPEGANEPGQAPDYTGQIKMGHIDLRGRLRSTKSGNFGNLGTRAYFAYAEDNGARRLHCWIDDVTQWTDEERFLLIISRSHEKPGSTYREISGLVLTRDTRCLTTFRRVGVFRTGWAQYSNKIYDDFMAQEEQTITLI